MYDIVIAANGAQGRDFTALMCLNAGVIYVWIGPETDEQVLLPTLTTKCYDCCQGI